jgi:NAD(P)-dependent dehydrogenase (short-subunit alcohol dehydrogenase family)
VFLTFRAAARHMAERGRGGSLVATASTAAVEGAARNSHYGASKGAVTSMVRALAVELARHRIRVNSILPGWIVTEMTERSVGNQKFADAVLPRIPARRWGQIDDWWHRGVPGQRRRGLHHWRAVRDRRWLQSSDVRARARSYICSGVAS